MDTVWHLLKKARFAQWVGGWSDDRVATAARLTPAAPQAGNPWQDL